jgi:hypothetical protein
MKQRIEEFGDADVYRFFCDGEDCSNPIRQGFKGKTGVYCSEACLKRWDETRFREYCDYRSKHPLSEPVPEASNGNGSHPAPASSKPVIGNGNGSGPKKAEATAKVFSTPKNTGKYKVYSPANTDQVYNPALPTRPERRIERRRLMKAIRTQLLTSLGHEPSINEMKRELEKRGFRVAIRTVWRDLNAVRK